MSDNDIAYRCDTHNCIVYESPCPHCGATDHESAPVVVGS